MSCYVGDRKWTAFEYARTGTREEGPWTWLAGREGYVPGRRGQHLRRALQRQAANATEVGCWARAPVFRLKDSDARAEALASWRPAHGSAGRIPTTTRG